MSIIVVLKSALGMQLTTPDLVKLQQRMLGRAHADLMEREEDLEFNQAMVDMLNRRITRLRASITDMQTNGGPIELVPAYEEEVAHHVG